MWDCRKVTVCPHAHNESTWGSGGIGPLAPEKKLVGTYEEEWYEMDNRKTFVSFHKGENKDHSFWAVTPHDVGNGFLQIWYISTKIWGITLQKIIVFSWRFDSKACAYIIEIKHNKIIRVMEVFRIFRYFCFLKVAHNSNQFLTKQKAK